MTYYPFSNGSCGSQNQNYSVLGTCINSILEPQKINFYPEKIPNDLNKCKVKVGSVNSPPFVIESAFGKESSSFLDYGVELALIDTVAKMANFQVELYNPSASLIDLVDDLTEKRIDIAIGTLSPTIEHHLKFDFSVQYTNDIITWIVPADQELPHWIGLLLVFQPTVYGVVILLLLFLWYSSSRIVHLCQYNFRMEHQYYTDSGTFLFVTIGMLLSNGPHTFPRTRFLKTILIMWSLFAFYWNSAFSSTLISVITNTVFKGGVRALNDGCY